MTLNPVQEPETDASEVDDISPPPDNPRTSRYVTVEPAREPNDFYTLTLIAAPLCGFGIGFGLARDYRLLIELIVAVGCMLGATLIWLGVQRLRAAQFLERFSDELEREQDVADTSYLVLWRLMERAASLEYLVRNDNHLFDVLQHVDALGKRALPLRVRSALTQYARRQVWTAIDKSFKSIDDIVRQEQRRVKHQSRIGLAAMVLAVVVATLGCLASFGVVPSVLALSAHSASTFTRDVTLIGSWASTSAVVALSAVLLAIAAMAFRALERHHVRALSLTERLRFASGLKASCALDLHPFLAQFAPPSAAEMKVLVRDPKSYDLVPLSDLVERPVQESTTLRDIAPNLRNSKGE